MENDKDDYLILQKQSSSFLTDSLRGVLKSDYDDKTINDERNEKYQGFQKQ